VNITVPDKNLTTQASSFEEAFFSAHETYIHPSAHVGPQVTLDPGVKVGPFCVITGTVHIGANTRLHAHVTIGFPGQVIGLTKSVGTIEIGSGCELREFVTVHAPRTEQGTTRIGNNCYIMNFAHISHDAVLEDNVTLINNATLGGHTHVEHHAIIMAYGATHQFCRIGQYTAFAPFSGTRQDIPPFGLFNLQPATFYGLNLIGLKRAGFSRDSINAVKHVTKLFYQDKYPLEKIIALSQQEPVWGSNQHVQTFLNFVTNSKRGVSRKAAIDAGKQSQSIELE